MRNIVQIIVNADDLGATPKVNDDTFELIDKGKVTSATMIANAPHFEGACQRIASYDSCSFGVHLNLTEFHPLVQTEAIQPLLDENGEFSGYDRVLSVTRSASLTEAVFTEFCAQMERCISAGVEVSHMDSHHHVHTIPWVMWVLKRVEKKFNIRRVRISKNIYGPRQPAPAKLRIKKAAYNFLLRHYVKTVTTDGFSEFQAFHEMATTTVLKHKIIELMIHPGSIDYEGSEEETDLLRTDWENQLMFPVELISYANLPLR